MQDQAQTLTQAVSVFKMNGGMASTPVQTLHKAVSKTITKLPSRGSAIKSAANQEGGSVKPRKVAAGGSDDTWEEF